MLRKETQIPLIFYQYIQSHLSCLALTVSLHCRCPLIFKQKTTKTLSSRQQVTIQTISIQFGSSKESIVLKLFHFQNMYFKKYDNM